VTKFHNPGEPLARILALEDSFSFSRVAAARRIPRFFLPKMHREPQHADEGQDYNILTHIIGLRRFTSRLLYEQVVGRGRRRFR